MKVIVTGGAGFIGSHLVGKLIEKKFKVIVLDNLSTGRIENLKHFMRKIKFIKCDISKKGVWMREFKNTNIVFHLAALADIVPSIENPNKYFMSNVIGTKNICNLAKKFKIKKIIYTASSSCYGVNKNYPTNENALIDPQYPYALTKRLGEEILIHYGKVYKIDFTSLRLFNVYGTRSRTSGTYGAMFGIFLAQKLKNKPATIVGNGKQKRDFTYVSDVVDAILKATKPKLKKNIINIGTGKPVSVNKIVELLKFKKKTYIPKRPGEPFVTHADVKLAKKILNWRSKIKIKDGIEILIKNINYWKYAPIWTPKKINKATKNWFKYLN